jgi:hypothetical protein
VFNSYSMLLRYSILIAAGAYGVNGEMTELLVGLGGVIFTLVWEGLERNGYLKKV